MVAPDGRPTMVLPPEEGEPPAPAPAPAAAPSVELEVPSERAQPPAPDENGELKYMLRKGPKGFGINIDLRGVVTGFSHPGSPAELAGVQNGTLVVRVNGNPVLGKPEVIAQLQAAAGVDTLEFCFMTSDGYMARKQAQEQAAQTSALDYAARPTSSEEQPAPQMVPVQQPALEEPEEQDEYAALAQPEPVADIPDLGDVDGGMDFLASVEAMAPPPAVEVEAPKVGIGRRKKKRRGSVEGVPASPSAATVSEVAPVAPDPVVDPVEAARLEAEAAAAAAAAEAAAAEAARQEAERLEYERAEQARIAAEQARIAAEQARVAAAEEAKRLAEEEARRLAEQTVSFRLGTSPVHISYCTACTCIR
jgi:hypothetical protein